MTDDHEFPSAQGERADPRVLIVLIAVTLVIRIGVLAAVPRTFADDPDAYRSVGVNMVEHGCFGHGDQPIASRPILYPLVVAACRLVDPALWYSLAVVHVILGTATVALTYLLGFRWGLGKWSAPAAVLVAVDPILLMHSTLVMTETLATFLAVAGLLAVTRCAERPTVGLAVLSGVTMALAVLCRPTFLVWMAAVTVLLPFVVKSWPNRARLFGAVLFSAAVTLSPWAIRNAVRFGKPTPVTTHGGFTLLLANNPSFYEYLRTARPGEVWNADQFNEDWRVRSQRVARGDEVAADRLAYSAALETIRNEPGTFAYACLVRLSRIWGVLPHRTTETESPLRRLARWMIAAFYGVEFVLAIVGLFSVARGRIPRDRLLRAWLWGLLLVVAFTAVHTFYWTNIRMRAPLIPVVCLVTAFGTAQIAARVSERKSFLKKGLRNSKGS